jgi:hypothetical protein
VSQNKVEKSSIISSEKKKAGRSKGVPNKKTFELREILDKHGVDPVDLLCWVIKKDYKSLDEPEEIEKIGFGGQVFYEKTITVEMRLDAAKALMGYIYPKRKATEHVIKNDSDKIILAYSEESLKISANQTNENK